MNPIKAPAACCRVMVLLLAAAAGFPSAVPAAVDTKPLAAPHAASAAWQAPKTEDVRKQLFQWLDAQKVDPPARDVIAKLWTDSSTAAGPELLGRLAESLAVVDPQVRTLVDQCAQRHKPGPLPGYPWLSDAKTLPLVARNMRLYYGCYLVRETLFDEALEQFKGLEPNEVVDPASLLFCEAVAYHGLVHRDEGLQAAERLLQDEQQTPKRYVALARLIQDDLKGVEDESLDHIARRMEDIRRRLDLGRAGPKVRSIEDGVVKSLSDLIKKIEDQQQQQQQGAGSGSLQSSSPAQDSHLMGGKGRGEVTQKNVGAKSGWGDLPPKQREEAMQQIGRDFPSHYREVIEQYFKKLAGEE